jgi:hypothetical protein
MKRVTLTIKKEENGQVVRVEEQFTIDKMSFGAMMSLVKEINGVMQDVKGNNDLKNLVEDAFKDMGGQDGQSLETIDDLNVMESLQDERFVNGLAGAFDYIIENLPDRAQKIISIASDIPVGTLQKAYAEEVLDVYDAIVEMNNIVSLWGRVKKSFLSTKDHWMGLVRKATN